MFGVDFSGARLAGANAWVATLTPAPGGRLALDGLDRLADLAGAAERGPALAHLAGMVVASPVGSVWGFDFPFGTPLELLPPGAGWNHHFALVRAFGDEAYAWGLELIRRAEALGLGKHVRRESDRVNRTPFDPYHYRIVYQAFYGSRDVLLKLRADPRTCVLPFDYARAGRAERVVVEACPACWLKARGWPHHSYKQPAGGPLAAHRRVARRAIVAELAKLVDLSAAHVRRIMRDPGADALDAVIAGCAAFHGTHAADHAWIARHPRYPREGRVYVDCAGG